MQDSQENLLRVLHAKGQNFTSYRLEKKRHPGGAFSPNGKLENFAPGGSTPWREYFFGVLGLLFRTHKTKKVHAEEGVKIKKMSFSKMVSILREGANGKIVFINAGAFYIAVEEDAVLLNNKLKLKCNCFQKNTCRVGVPINYIDQYLRKIEKLGYGYIVYNINKEKELLKVIREFNGKKNKTERKNINCLMCKGIEAFGDDVYIDVLDKFYREQRNEREY